MGGKGNIIWLASYPKSGNTWLRVFFANLLSKSDEPANINDLKISTIASNRDFFDEYCGIPSSDLSFEEIESLRPLVYEEISKQSEVKTFFKVHDAYIFTKEGKPMFPLEASFRAIYIIRNPLSVAASFAHHLDTSLEKAVENMNNPAYCFCSNQNSLSVQLEQKLFNWSMHVQSWLGQKEIETMVVRYEDMVSNPVQTFGKAANFCELDFSDEKLLTAIKNSSFEVLQEQEKRSGFKEKPGKAKSFFRKGESEGWKTELDKNLVASIIEHHAPMMKKFGYL